MKLRHVEPAPGRVDAELAGDLEVASCTCLRNFWELRLAHARALTVDLSAVESVDADGLAELLELLRAQLADGARVTLTGVPDDVRAALDAVGLAGHAGLTL